MPAIVVVLCLLGLPTSARAQLTSDDFTLLASEPSDLQTPDARVWLERELDLDVTNFVDDSQANRGHGPNQPSSDTPCTDTPATPSDPGLRSVQYLAHVTTGAPILSAFITSHEILGTVHDRECLDMTDVVGSGVYSSYAGNVQRGFELGGGDYYFLSESRHAILVNSRTRLGSDDVDQLRFVVHEVAPAPAEVAVSCVQRPTTPGADITLTAPDHVDDVTAIIWAPGMDASCLPGRCERDAFDGSSEGLGLFECTFTDVDIDDPETIAIDCDLDDRPIGVVVLSPGSSIDPSARCTIAPRDEPITDPSPTGGPASPFRFHGGGGCSAAPGRPGSGEERWLAFAILLLACLRSTKR